MWGSQHEEEVLFSLQCLREPRPTEGSDFPRGSSRSLVKPRLGLSGMPGSKRCPLRSRSHTTFTLLRIQPPGYEQSTGGCTEPAGRAALPTAPGFTHAGGPGVDRGLAGPPGQAGLCCTLTDLGTLLNTLEDRGEVQSWDCRRSAQ